MSVFTLDNSFITSLEMHKKWKMRYWYVEKYILFLHVLIVLDMD